VTCPDCGAVALEDGFGGYTCPTGSCPRLGWCDHSGPPRDDRHTCCHFCDRSCLECSPNIFAAWIRGEF
jgi:hypothetical protein